MVSDSFLQIYYLSLIFTLVSCVSVSVVFARRRNQPGASPFLLLMGCLVLWAFAYAVELSTGSFEQKLFWFNVRQTGITVVPLAFWMLAYEINTRKRGAPLRFLIPLAAFAALSLVLIWTSGSHQLLRTSVSLAPVADTAVIRVRGTWFQGVEILYYMGLLVATCALLVDAARRTPQAYRGQVLSIALTLILPWVLMLISGLGFNPIAPLGIGTFFLPLVAIGGGIAIYRYRLFDIVPIAHDKVLKSITSGLIVTDERGRIIEINPLATHLLKPHASPVQMLGKPLESYLSEHPQWASVTNADSESIVEITARSGDDLITYEVKSTPIHEQRGNSIGTLTLINDITDRKRADEQTMELALEREKLRLWGRFIQDASHDLNTPISVVYMTGYVTAKLSDKMLQQFRVLRRSPNLSPDEQLQLLEMETELSRIIERIKASEAAAERLGRTVSTMLEAARLERDLVLKREANDINLLLRELISDYGTEITANNLTLTFQPDEQMPNIPVDAGEIKRALGQLLENAVTYTLNGGKIDVRTSRTSGTAVIEIQDTGIGISDEDMPHIFDQFFRADAARSTDTGGSGLGLVIARRIIEAHGGDISLESQVGLGTTARVRLPLHHIDTGTLRARETENRAAATADQVNVS